MVRRVGNYDYDRYHRIGRWPLRELCIAYASALQEAERREFEIERLSFAPVAPYLPKTAKAPKPSPRLRRAVD